MRNIFSFISEDNPDNITLYVKMHLDSFLNFPLCLFVRLGIRAYEQLGYRAFGRPGKILAACIITLHNVGGKIKCITVYISEVKKTSQLISRITTLSVSSFDPTAMSSYLFIVKIELPHIIQGLVELPDKLDNM